MKETAEKIEELAAANKTLRLELNKTKDGKSIDSLESEQMRLNYLTLDQKF